MNVKYLINNNLEKTTAGSSAPRQPLAADFSAAFDRPPKTGPDATEIIGNGR
jgi:hypothetical protein